MSAPHATIELLEMKGEHPFDQVERATIGVHCSDGTYAQLFVPAPDPLSPNEPGTEAWRRQLTKIGEALLDLNPEHVTWYSSPRQ